MLDNKVYNLMIQLIQEHKSLWRIRNHYINECGDDEDQKKFWTMMEEDKKEHIEDLLNLLKKEL